MLYATCAVKGNVVLDVSYAACVYSKSFFRVSWRNWDTWPKSCNVHLDASAFKTELLNKSLHLEMEDLGDMTKILKCTPGLLSLQNHDKTELLKKMYVEMEGLQLILNILLLNLLEGLK